MLVNCITLLSAPPPPLWCRKSYEFEDLLQSSSEHGRVDWYAQTKLALTRTLSEENVYEDILGRSPAQGRVLPASPEQQGLLVNRHSAEVLNKVCLLSKCKPGHTLRILLASNKKNGWGTSKLINFKDKPEAYGKQPLFFAGISSLSSFCPVD